MRTTKPTMLSRQNGVSAEGAGNLVAAMRILPTEWPRFFSIADMRSCGRSNGTGEGTMTTTYADRFFTVTAMDAPEPPAPAEDAAELAPPAPAARWPRAPRAPGRGRGRGRDKGSAPAGTLARSFGPGERPDFGLNKTAPEEAAGPPGVPDHPRHQPLWPHRRHAGRAGRGGAVRRHRRDLPGRRTTEGPGRYDPVAIRSAPRRCWRRARPILAPGPARPDPAVGQWRAFPVPLVCRQRINSRPAGATIVVMALNGMLTCAGSWGR